MQPDQLPLQDIVGTVFTPLGRAESGDRVVYRPDHPDPLLRCCLVIPMDLPPEHVILDLPSQRTALRRSLGPPVLRLLL